MKSEQFPRIEKCICLTMLSVNSVYKFSGNYSLNFAANINSSYFSKMALVGFQYEPVSLDVSKVYFEEEQDIPKKNQEKVKAFLNRVNVGNEV